MPLSTFTGLSTLAATVPTDNIQSFVQEYNWAPTIGEMVAWVSSIESGRGGTIQFPRWPELTCPPTAVGETDEYSDQAVTPVVATCSPSVYGFAVPLSREGEYDTVINAVDQALLVQMVESVRQLQDRHLLALAAHDDVEHVFDQTSDGIFGETTLLEALARYRDLSPPAGSHALIIGSQGLRDLQDVIMSATAPAQARLDMFNGLSDGFVGSVLGVQVIHSRNLYVADGAEHAILTPVGDGLSGLGLGIAWGIGAEVEELPNRRAKRLMVGGRWGTTITNPDRVLVIRTRASA